MEASQDAGQETPARNAPGMPGVQAVPLAGMVMGPKPDATMKGHPI